MGEGRLQQGCGGHPSGEPDGSADHRGEHTQNPTGGHRDQAQLAGRGADGGEHAELPLAPLGHGQQAGSSHDAHQQQRHGHEAEDADRRDHPLVGGPRRHGAAGARRAEGAEPVLISVDQDGDRGQGDLGPGRDQGELGPQIGGVLHGAHHPPDPAVDGDGSSREQRGRTVGEGDLVRTGRVAPVPQTQQGTRERPARLQGPQLDGVGRPGHRQLGEPDDVDHTEMPAGLGQ